MIRYGFFNSINGDRAYSADDIGGFFANILTDGILITYKEKFEVQKSEGLQVFVGAGRALIKNKWIESTEREIINLDAAEDQERIDTIAIRLDKTKRKVEICVLKGQAEAEPKEPQLTQNEEIFEIPIANIIVEAAVAEIGENDIVDRRVYSKSMLSETISVEENYIITTEDENIKIEHGLTGYERNKNEMEVYINGLRIHENTNYTIHDNTSITLKNKVGIGNEFIFRIFR